MYFVFVCVGTLFNYFTKLEKEMLRFHLTKKTFLSKCFVLTDRFRICFINLITA